MMLTHPIYYFLLTLTSIQLNYVHCSTLDPYSEDPPGPQVIQDPGPGDLNLLRHGAVRPHVEAGSGACSGPREREKERERKRESG